MENLFNLVNVSEDEELELEIEDCLKNIDRVQKLLDNLLNQMNKNVVAI